MNDAAEPPFRAIADSTYDWETWIDSAGIVRWTNPAVLRFTGYSVEECLAMEGFPLVLIFETDRDAIAAVLDDAGRGGSGNDIELRIRHRDGSERWAAISYQSLIDLDGTSRGYRMSVRDIELRKLWERELRASERVAARAADERAELLATLSHELRSPLHCIAGFAELLARAERSSEEKRYIGWIESYAAASLRLVEDLLRFAADLGRDEPLRREPFDVRALVAGELEAARNSALAGVRIALDDAGLDHVIRLGDADRIRQILSNLVGNALRFTERGEVRVRLAAEGDGILIAVDDTGVGMSPEDLARSREPFFQSAKSRRSRGGAGLGLAVVSSLAARLGGRLDLASTVGVGTTATVHLPDVPETTEAPRATTPSSTESLGALDVLVVDDVAAARELAVAMLETLGVHARTAASGHEAISACEAQMPDVVLLDLHMPGLDGLETSARIRGIPGATRDRVRIVVITANVLARNDAADVDAWAIKPLRRDGLAALLRGTTRPRTIDDSVDDAADLDDAVLDELATTRGPDGRTLLEARGPALVRALREAIDRARDADAGSIRAAAHDAKGLASMLGARAIALAAAKLEAADDPTETKTLLRRAADAQLPRIEARIARRS